MFVSVCTLYSRCSSVALGGWNGVVNGHVSHIKCDVPRWKISLGVSSLMAALRRNFSSYFRPIPASLRIGLEINRGAYGTVHEGQLDGCPVAVKKIHRLLLEAASGERDTWERVVRDFEKECRLLEGLKHPHIVGFSGAFYDVQSEEPVLVMERMRENLRDLLGRERQLSLRRQLQICLEIAIGLEFLHSRSPPVAHRDLNDKNVMLSEEGVVKLGDLGQSRLKENSVDYFSTGQPGAVPFMPPEALSEHPHYTEKIDMFSLGVLMLEISTGRYPSVKLFGIGLQPEVVRRREDLSMLSDGHPLKPFILHCLKDNYKNRPPAVIVRCFVERVLVSVSTSDGGGVIGDDVSCQPLVSMWSLFLMSLSLKRSKVAFVHLLSS